MNADGSYKTDAIRNGEYDFYASNQSHINKCWYPDNQFRKLTPLERRKLLLNQLEADKEKIRQGIPLSDKCQAAQLRIQEQQNAAYTRATRAPDSRSSAPAQGATVEQMQRTISVLTQQVEQQGRLVAALKRGRDVPVNSDDEDLYASTDEEEFTPKPGGRGSNRHNSALTRGSGIRNKRRKTNR